LLSRYALSGLREYWPATEGIENSNYFIRLATEGGDRELVLTLLEQPGHSSDLLVPLLDECEAAGLPIPPVVRNREGEPRDAVNGKPAILSPRLAGQHVVHPTIGQCESVGEFLARFHAVAAPLTAIAPPYPRDALWIVRAVERVLAGLPFTDAALLESACTTVTSLLDRSDARHLPTGVIHGDLFRDNVLFTGRCLTGVLDFHHAAAAAWVYDLAVAANDWCTDGDGVLDHDRAMALLRGYHALRPLRLQELWFFPVFALYGALAFWLSRLIGVRAGDERTKNPDEFRRIVDAHMSRFFYIDPRLLY
jgi:homoserine kinase type II